ncbi:MAG: flavodoxin [Candidatus Omnitrophota bacterium]|jgi:multimeric flavodoxin WrbA
MKILITYYSYSGITDKVMHMYEKHLEKNDANEINIQRLKPKEEITSFIGQCRAAFTKKRCDLLEGIIFDASPYDLIVIASPVWAFAPTPAVNTFLDKLNGMSGKKAIVLLTSGSGAGVKNCFKHIKTVLESKGVSRVGEINIPNSKMKDENSIISSLEKALQ